MTQLANITLDHRAYVEQFTRKHFPYSDFNFTSLWSWDTDGKVRIGEHGGNFVVRFTDYLTSEPFYSFLGGSGQNETALALLRQSADEGLPPELRLMPECSVAGLDPGIFVVTEDQDHFDYVYDIDEHTRCEGKKFTDHRYKMNRFVANHASKPEWMVEIRSQQAVEARESVLFVNKRWRLSKDATEEEMENERIAIERMFQAAHEKILVFSLYAKGYPVAYWTVEILDHEYVLAHFGKADASFKGANQYLMRSMCETLAAQSKRLLNCEQDLGIPGLRQSKNALRPSHFLKKYRVRLK